MTTFSDDYVLKLEKQVAEMQEDCDLLYALQAAGVDNWEGYEFAMEILHENTN